MVLYKLKSCIWIQLEKGGDTVKFGRGRGVNKILKMGGWVANQYNKGGGGLLTNGGLVRSANYAELSFFLLMFC